MTPPLPHTVEGLRTGQYRGLKKLKLCTNLTSFPTEILALADTLEVLDLSGNPGLSTLPAEISTLHRLKIAFFSHCSFTTFPSALARCPSLEMVAFRSNRMAVVPEGALPSCTLRWLILTDNEIQAMPRDVGECGELRKCMLAGNRLASLPDEMSACSRLALLRLSVNRFEELPAWLFDMPELAFFSFAGNPCSATQVSRRCPRGPFAKGCNGNDDHHDDNLQSIPRSDLTIQRLLGEGASGIMSKATWARRDQQGEATAVAIKIFKGALTSDGSPSDEMDASIAAGQHGNLISPLGRIDGLGEGRKGLALELVPEQYANLGLPPTLDTCTRDVFPADMNIGVRACKSVLLGVARAAEHLHARGVAHGDLYAHNILFDAATGHALLGDFGAATVYGKMSASLEEALERLEVLAFGHLIQDLLGLVRGSSSSACEMGASVILEALVALQTLCTGRIVSHRPPFRVVREILEGL